MEPNKSTPEGERWGGKRPAAGRPRNKKVEKSRDWAIGLYLESAVDGWRDILRQNAVPFAVSPIHDRDIWLEDQYDEAGNLEHKKGDPKKPHWHIQFRYRGPTTYNNVLELSKKIGGTKAAINVGDAKKYYEYLTHKNDHDKAQYDEADIETYCGFNAAEFGLGMDEVDQVVKNLMKLSCDNGWLDYHHLMDYLVSHDMALEFRVARTNTRYFMGWFLGRWRSAERMRQKTDPTTGEVM